MGRKPKKTEKARVNDDLKGFELKIDQFGEIQTNVKIAELNDFLDKNVTDKKFKGIKIVKRKENHKENQKDNK